MQRLVWGWMLLVVAVFALAAPAQAGGWAVVTLDTLPDTLPDTVRAGQPLQLGFTVRQHGHTPNSDVEPVLAATSAATGETLQFAATQQGAVGHFVVDVTFPDAGTWEWSITPEPFAATPFEPLTVLPAAASMPQADAATLPARLPEPSMLRGTGLALLVLALALAFGARRRRMLDWGRPHISHGTRR